ncbi:hypothetical protein SAMN05443247_04658 [Bradyrhizobium erythrophlei]|nr:hypothetical protein SAMN05443247_04658 [Bradyrhizobium erythrophlei]
MVVAGPTARRALALFDRVRSREAKNGRDVRHRIGVWFYETPSANQSGPVIIQKSFRQAIPTLLRLAAVAASLIAAPGPDGVLGAFLGALMLAIAASDLPSPATSFPTN